MTVPAQSELFNSSTANGVTTSFPYTFMILSADDIVVMKDGVIQASGFTITGVGSTSGGAVVFSVAPANGVIVNRYLDVSLERATDYQQFGDWAAETVNADMDRIVLGMQSLDRKVERAIKMPSNTAGDQVITDSAADRVGKLVTFDASGNVELVELGIAGIADASDVAYTRSDGSLTNVQANSREKLTANRTYYVRTDGSDSNTGLANTAGGAFLTIQAALNVIDNDLDLNGYIAVIQVADGTYTEGATASGSWMGDGDVYVLGNATTPANCIINTTSADAFVATKGATLLVSGFKPSTTTSGCCVKASLGAYIALGVMDYGACAESHIECGTCATIVPGSNYTISGGAVSHLHCGAPGTILAGTITVTLTGTPAFSAYFAGVAEGTITVTGVTWSGSATGRRYLAHKGGVIDVGAGTITTLPGDVAGYSDVSGTYCCTTGVQDAQYFGGPSTAPAVKVVPVVDQDRHVILTGADASSGSPNPSISVSGGVLSIQAAVVGTGTVQCLTNTATPAGGTVAFYMGADAVGIYFGSGAPSVVAARGSLYIRTDNGANTSLYINRDGGTTWAAVTSA